MLVNVKLSSKPWKRFSSPWFYAGLFLVGILPAIIIFIKESLAQSRVFVEVSTVTGKSVVLVTEKEYFELVKEAHLVSLIKEKTEGLTAKPKGGYTVEETHIEDALTLQPMENKIKRGNW